MPRPFSPVRDDAERDADEQRVQEHLAPARRRGLRAWRSPSSTTAGRPGLRSCRCTHSPKAARAGVGFSPVIDAFISDGSIDPASPLDTPDGDLRLVPDLDRLVVLRDPGRLGVGARRPVPPGRHGLRQLPADVRAGAGRRRARPGHQRPDGDRDGVDGRPRHRRLRACLPRHRLRAEPVPRRGPSTSATCSRAWKPPACASSRSIRSTARLSSRCRWPPQDPGLGGRYQRPGQARHRGGLGAAWAAGLVRARPS